MINSLGASEANVEVLLKFTIHTLYLGLGCWTRLRAGFRARSQTRARAWT